MKPLKIIFFNILLLFILFTIVELFFGGWIFNKNNMDNLNIIRNRTISMDVSGLYDYKNKVIKYSRDNFGLRGSLPNQPNKIDILSVGGSTTDQRYIEDGETWQDIIEKNFAAAGKSIIISNAGVDGQSTVGHIKNFDLWFPNIEGLKPKYILFYIGINDFYAINNESFDQLQGKTWKDKIKNYSVLFNLFRKLKGVYQATLNEVGHRKEDFSAYQYTVTPNNSKKDYHELMKIRNDSYSDRVRLLIEKSRQSGAQPIFITQPTRYYKINNQNIVEGNTKTFEYNAFTGNGVDYYYMMREQDRAMFSIVNSYGVQYFDLANEKIWEDDDFYDLYHMNPKGIKKVGTYLFNKLNAQLKNTP